MTLIVVIEALSSNPTQQTILLSVGESKTTGSCGKQRRPRSDAAFWSTPLAQACLSEY